jgi:8-amino-7-oxononanoate synthase
VNFDWLSEAVEQRRREQLDRSLRLAEPGPQATVLVDGRRLVNFASNDYLGLASHPQLCLAASQASESSLAASPLEPRYGSGASPLISGYTPDHALLEQALAELEQAEAAMLFSSGYAANLGVISALAGAGDVIFSDALNHASLIDGCRLARATTWVYAHADCHRLQHLLQQHRQPYRRAFIVTDSIFSMDGDTAPLVQLAELAEAYDAMVIVDEAHATGVIGERGGGVVESLKLQDRIPVRIGTLSKALGCIGGFVAGSQALIDYLRNFCRPYIYSTSMPIANAKAARVAVALARGMAEERRELSERSRWLRQQLRDLGYTIDEGDSPIVPIYLGQADAVLAYANHLMQLGLWIPAIRPPTVPPNQARLRVSLSVQHTQDYYERLVEGLAECRQRFTEVDGPLSTSPTRTRPHPDAADRSSEIRTS